MTLNGRHALCCRKNASFGANHSQRQKCFWRQLRFMRIFVVVPRRGDVKRQRQFSALSSAISLETRDEANLIIQLYTARSLLFSDPKMLILNDLEWLFRVKFCFRASLAVSDRATFENNCVKINKDSTYCQRCKSLAGTLVSGSIRFVRIFARIL